MPILSWIVPTHYRPQLLGAALRTIRAQEGVPSWWQQEVLVVAMIDDRAAHATAREHQVLLITTDRANAGGKRNAGLSHAKGELVLTADDDDLQSPLRAAASIANYELGYEIGSMREFRYVHLATGHCVRWRGLADNGEATAPVGLGRAHAKHVLDGVGGWCDQPRSVDTEWTLRVRRLRAYYAKRGLAFRERDLSTYPQSSAAHRLATTTVFLQHDRNLWPDRADLGLGQTSTRGRWQLRGEGHVLTDRIDPPIPPLHRGILEELLA